MFFETIKWLGFPPIWPYTLQISQTMTLAIINFQHGSGVNFTGPSLGVFGIKKGGRQFEQAEGPVPKGGGLCQQGGAGQRLG